MKKLLLPSSLLFVFLMSFFAAKAQNSIVAQNSSSPVLCNGFAYFSDSTMLETSIAWYGGGVVLQQGGYGLGGLCPGTYTVTYSINGTSFTETFVIGDASSDPCFGFEGVLTTTNATDDVTCDGGIVASVVGGTAPYTYLWSNGVTTTSQSTLCIGVYSVTISDANGCSNTQTVYLSSNVNTGDTLIVIENPNFEDSVIVDDLGEEWLADCVLDYFAVDSVYIGGIAYSTGDSLIYLTWYLVDENGTVLVNYVVEYPTGDTLNGVYSASLMIYCPQRASEVEFLQLSDKIYVGMEASVLENEEFDFTVVNPFTEELIVYLESTNEIELELVDLQGNVVAHKISNAQNEVRIETISLSAGTYLLRSTIGSEFSVRKVIKN